MSDLKTTKIVVDNVGRQSLPVIAREDVEKNYIHKDKIREKIKELEKDMVLPETRAILKELLEE